MIGSDKGYSPYASLQSVALQAPQLTAIKLNRIFTLRNKKELEAVLRTVTLFLRKRN